MTQATVTNELWELGRIQAYGQNAKIHDEAQVAQIVASIKEFGVTSPLIVAADGSLIAGHGRLAALKELGYTDVPVRVLSGLSDAQVRKLRLADNKIAENAVYDDALLQAEIAELIEAGEDLVVTGFSQEELDELLSQDPLKLAGSGSGSNDPKEKIDSGGLARRFGVPPFSVLSARDGWWQDRKRSWISLGIKSEIGRGGLGDTSATPMEYFGDGKTIAGDSGSVFDPVLCELAYRWFSPDGGVVLDPFSGGSVRGVVAAKLGRTYVGIDLRQEQVEANRDQWERINAGDEIASPVWHHGDSRNIGSIAGDIKADMIFSCPPYADLEVYSDDPADLSTLDYAEFQKAYAEIIAATAAQLVDDRFACFVVGDVRDRHGAYYNFVGDTVEAFRAAGLSYYNEAILVTPAGTLPLRAGKQFTASRKLGKSHQNILVFLKGNAKRATEAIGQVEFGDSADFEEAA